MVGFESPGIELLQRRSELSKCSCLFIYSCDLVIFGLLTSVFIVSLLSSNFNANSSEKITLHNLISNSWMRERDMILQEDKHL